MPRLRDREYRDIGPKQKVQLLHLHQFYLLKVFLLQSELIKNLVYNICLSFSTKKMFNNLTVAWYDLESTEEMCKHDY